MAMTWTWTWIGFFIGFGVGLLVLLGLAAGTRIFIDLAAQPDLPKPLRRRKIALALFYFVGQLGLAIVAMLYTGREHLFSLGVGLVLCLITLSIISSFKL